MRRCIWITLLVAVLLVCAWLVQHHMHRQIEGMQAEFETLEALIRAGDSEAAKAGCRRIVQEWDEKREFWEIFIDHASLDDAESTIYELKGYILSDAPAYQTYAFFSRLEADLVQIDMQTRLSLGHLF